MEINRDPLGQLDQLRGSVRTKLRARRWLDRWRSESAQPWDGTHTAAMSANAVELSALTTFVALHREPQVTSQP